MRKPIIAALLVAGVAGAAPVAAQGWYSHSWDRPGYARTIYGDACDNNRAQRMYFAIRRGVQTDRISWQEARDLRAAVDRTAYMQRDLCARGLNGYRADRLDRQWDRVEDMVRSEMRY